MRRQERRSGGWLSLLFIMMLIGQAQSAAAEGIRPIILGGLAVGGDTLVKTTQEDLTAGGLIYMGLGVLIEPNESPLQYQISMGYKFDTVQFTSPSGDASISTFPLDAVIFYKHEKFRFGGGVALYLNPKYELCFDSGGCATAHFDNATGLLAEVRYQMNDKSFLGLRYTKVEYELGNVSVDASNVQFHVGFIFN